MKEIEYKEEYKYLTHICLNVTDDCNLQCKYCFVQQKPHYMELQTAKDTADWLYNNLVMKYKNLGKDIDYKDCSINFFGGEPTLMWDTIIVPLTKYIREKYGFDFGLGITTNGTLLNEERIDFLKENKMNILLSIDGAKETQSINRPCKNKNKNSFDLVSKNIPKILETFPNVTFRATIDQSTVEHTFENYLFAEQCGFKNCFFTPNEREKWSDEKLDILSKEISKIYYYNLQYFLNDKIPPLQYELIQRSFKVVKAIDTELLMKHEMFNGQKGVQRCGMGTTYGSVSYDGTVYACQEQDSRSTNDLFYIGNIYDGINENKHKKLLNMYANCGVIQCEDNKLCESCKRKLVCIDDICPSTTMDLFGNFNTATKTHCVFSKVLIDNTIALMKILVPLNNDAFKKYMDFIYKVQEKEEDADGN